MTHEHVLQIGSDPRRLLDRRRFFGHGLRLGLAGSAALAARHPLAPGRRFASAAAADGETFTALISFGSDDLDPHSSYTVYGSLVMLGAYELLIQYRGDSTTEFAPMLAESWDANTDDSVFTFTLPAGVLFHDGTPCDAQAVKDSFTRFLQLGMGPVNVISRFVSDPAQIEVVDPTTVRFDLGRPQPLFLSAMASSFGPYVVSPSAVAAHRTDDDPWAHQWLLANAVGTGPYRLTDHEPGERFVLDRFEAYHGGWDDAKFARVVLRVVPEDSTRRQLLEQGEADAATANLTPEDVAELRGNFDLQVLTYDTTRVNWAIMNAAKLPREARQGFSYAFPYDEVIDGVYKGMLKRSGPVAAAVRGSDPNVFLYQTDLARAKDLILSAGIAEGDSFEYVVEAGNAAEEAAAQLFQANVQAMGFDLDISAIDGSLWEGLVFGDAPPEERPDFIGGWFWWPDYNDAWNMLAPNFAAAAIGNGGGNGGAWVNPRFEEIMPQAAATSDEQTYFRLMTEAQNILTEQDPPVIYAGEAVYSTVLGAHIGGFVANPFYLETYPFYAMSRTSE